MKNKILLGSLLFASCLQTEAPAATMPSVADVFGGMSEEEITKQVQLGQQFLEDLEKFGTPEEKAQFEQLLVETLNSMSETDFNDIQQIAKMVEPNLEIPSAVEPQVPAISNTAPKEEMPIVQVESTDVENFKALISSITQRIDDILQKMNSSKDCAQEVDTRWSTKATFNNMKRQIYQLRNTRLAQKLTKPDISGDDKILVDDLKKFLKELTQQNDSFVVEDGFGLSSSREVEQNQLKSTKLILTMFDSYIDNLMPKLEKFLAKWDPEALQLAKEAEEKTTRALKDTSDATVRRSSPDARPLAQQPYGNQQPSSSRSAGYNPAYYDQTAMPTDYQGYTAASPLEAATDSNSPSNTNTNNAAAKTPPTAPKAAPEISEKRQKAADVYEDATDAINDHLNAYNNKYQQEFSDFLERIAKDYPLTSTTQPGQPEGIAIQEPDLKSWFDNKIEPYTKAVFKELSDKFNEEFLSIIKACENVSNSIANMDAETAKKLSSYSGLTTVEQRFNQYKQNYEKAINAIDAQFKKNLDLVNDETGKAKYNTIQTNFIQQLHTDLEKRIDKSREEIAMLNVQARRKSNRKARTTTNLATTLNN